MNLFSSPKQCSVEILRVFVSCRWGQKNIQLELRAHRTVQEEHGITTITTDEYAAETSLATWVCTECI